MNTPERSLMIFNEQQLETLELIATEPPQAMQYAGGNAALPAMAEWDGILLLYGKALPTSFMMRMLAALALQARPLAVIDGANRFDPYQLARLFHRARYAPESLLQHIFISRAFTCYQLVERIESLGFDGPRPAAVLCLNMLDSFYDEDVSPNEAIRLLRRALSALLQQQRRGLPVVVTAQPAPASLPHRAGLLERLRAASSRVYRLEVQEDNYKLVWEV